MVSAHYVGDFLLMTSHPGDSRARVDGRPARMTAGASHPSNPELSRGARLAPWPREMAAISDGRGPRPGLRDCWDVDLVRALNATIKAITRWL